ncbi:MAG: IS110 family transposase [Symbiobacteriaceae bacterium]|nr:IS110 family transposase [Symbiobacteriaceae bacterium]
MSKVTKRESEGSAPEVSVLYDRCAGIDVHKDKVTVCLIFGKDKAIREFGTMTGDLLECIDWLEDSGCEMVLMESTGPYWKPVYNILEAYEMPTQVANAAAVKAIAKRKTDIKDAEWLATLVRYGLVKNSFIPSKDMRESRELVRYRKSIVQDRAGEINRIQKVLEGANIKLSSVVSDIQGVSAMAILRLIATGETDPNILSEQARGSLRFKIPQLQKALFGSIGQHQMKMLVFQLDHYDFLSKLISDLDIEIKEKLQTEDQVIEQLTKIPGVGRRSAEGILAEIGSDMSRFPSAGHLTSWAGLVPGMNESAGVKKPASLLPGNKHLRTVLIESAWAAVRQKGSFFAAKYYRLKPKSGAKRAIVATARAILVTIYHMLKTGTTYNDLGADYFTKLDQEKITKRNIRALERQGYTVHLSPLSATLA